MERKIIEVNNVVHKKSSDH